MGDQYSQPPFFGYNSLPYTFPPQQMPPAQADGQGSLLHLQQAPIPDAFQSIPGLAASNMTSYGQNNQQLPFPPTAWPHMPPGPNMWLSLIQQNSALPPPPLPGLPGFSFPPPTLPQTPHTPQNPATPLAFPPHLPPQVIATPQRLPPQLPPQLPPHRMLAPGDRIQEVMESDREDGELSEGEVSSHPAARNGKGRTHAEPPRSVPQAPPHVEEGYNPDHPSAGQKTSQAPVRRPVPQVNAESPVAKIQKQRDEAKQFVKILHGNNIGYRVLANEDLNIELLKELYQSLNLPSEPASVQPPKTNGASKLPIQTPIARPVTQQGPSVKAQQQKSSPAIKTNISPALSTKAPSPTAPLDRKDYIARLQAARMGKQAGTVIPSPPQKTPPPQPAAVVPTVKTPQPVTSPVAKAPVTEEQRARNTEMIKQRLIVLKTNAKLQSTSTNGIAASTGPAVRSVDSQQARGSGPNPPMAHPQVSIFPGIPGLFMNASSTSNSNTTSISRPLPSLSKKRTAPSDSTEVSTPRDSSTPHTRQLSQSPHTNEDNIIIQGNDNESNEDDMDIDDDQTASPPSAPSAHLSASNQRPVLGGVSDFLSRSVSAYAASSAISTHGPQTPNTLAREKELEDKEKQLMAMRLTLKKKLAEKREKDKAAAAAAVEASTPLPHDSSKPGSPPHSESRSEFVSSTPKVADLALPYPVSTSGTVAQVDRDYRRDTKRVRRAEIQSKLPSLDAEIATNAFRMAQLTKEMELLAANNERIMRDKEQLTAELESLGIDTEGMSHAELRAKKDQLEHEMNPEDEHTSQGPSPTAQLSPIHALNSPLSSAPEILGVSELGKTSAPSGVPVASQKPTEYTTLPGLGQAAPSLFEKTPVVEDHSLSADEAVAPLQHHELIPQDVSQPTSLTVDGSAFPNDVSVVTAIRASATPPDDEEDFYSPPPPAEMDINNGVNEHEPRQAQSVTYSIAGRSPSEEREIEMSVSSEEEEYEPEESAVVNGLLIQECQAPDTEKVIDNAISQISTEDEEDYEPPDVDQEMPVVQSETAIADPSTSAPHVEAEDGAMDISTSSEEEIDDSDSDEESILELEGDLSMAANNILSKDTNIVSPQQPSDPNPAIAAPQEVPAVFDQDEPPKFTPYESPLRMFKSYRYHPSYAQDVAGGFLSWTYSHQINPEKPLCQYELAGGSCNDVNCPDQHFRDIGITGEKLLVQLGTANPGKTPEEKQRWNDGLRGVLKELRTKNIKDPNGIAVEIANYRRQFLNDDTRVVNL